MITFMSKSCSSCMSCSVYMYEYFVHVNDHGACPMYGCDGHMTDCVICLIAAD